MELRWVKRLVPAPQYGEGVGTLASVLQYRTHTIDLCAGKCGWSDWQDVPTVEENA